MSVKQITIEELKKKFRVANVPDRGKCIIIPVDKFESEWDQLILDAGLESHAGEDVIYVYLNDEEVQLTGVTESTLRSPGERKIRDDLWRKDEDKLLIELWNQKPRLKRDDVARTPAPFPPSTGAEPGQMLDDIIRVLEKHSKLLDKLECQMLMRVLELKQQKGELTIPPNLRVHCVNALLEDDVKFRMFFRKKVKQLLEASQ